MSGSQTSGLCCRSFLETLCHITLNDCLNSGWALLRRRGVNRQSQQKPTIRSSMQKRCSMNSWLLLSRRVRSKAVRYSRIGLEKMRRCSIYLRTFQCLTWQAWFNSEFNTLWAKVGPCHTMSQYRFLSRSNTALSVRSTCYWPRRLITWRRFRSCAYAAFAALRRQKIAPT